MDGAVINVSGIPAGGLVTVTPVKQTRSAGSSALTDKINAQLSEMDKNTTQMFLWDISVQDSEGDDWQPFAKPVTVEVDLPDVKLHPYTEVFVIHIDDNGNVDTLKATVTENGGIAFETPGFSTFAGFTVDFEYDNARFSINGLTSILLSELFEHLQMPLYVSDVADVEFTDTSLVTVTAKDGDWELKSLKAFQTTESLTLTMKDGTQYVIKVTDAAYPVYYVGSGAANNPISDSNGTITWHADGDGNLSNTTDTNHPNPGWSMDKILYIDGTNATNKKFKIEIQVHPDANLGSGAVTNVAVLVKQIRVMGGAEVSIRLGASTFNVKNPDECLLGPAVAGENLIYVEDGSIDIMTANEANPIDKTKLVLTGKSTYKNSSDTLVTVNTTMPLITMRRYGDGLRVDDVTFRDARNGAIQCRTNEGTSIQLINCRFESTVTKTGSTYGGRGAALYVTQGTHEGEGGTSKNVSAVDLTSVVLDKCTFTGVTARDAGGAVAIYGRVKDVTFNGCTFTECKSTTSSGGAIALGGTIDKAVVAGCTFTNCSSGADGGAIQATPSKIETTNDSGKYSRIHRIEIRKSEKYNVGNTFTGCTATGHAGAINLESQTGEVVISTTNFKNCTADKNGGAITVQSVAVVKNWMGNGTDFAYGTSARTYVYDFGTMDDTEYGIRSTMRQLSIDSCGFDGCTAGGLDKTVEHNGNGGAIEFGTASYTDIVNITNSTFTNCKAHWSGSAIYLSNCILEKLTAKATSFSNCDFWGREDMKDANGNPVLDDEGRQKYSYPFTDKGGRGGGTFRTIGNTTAVVDFINCTFKDNKTRQNGGAIYWNANYTRNGVQCKLTISADPDDSTKRCLFEGNLAPEDGGAIFCESTMVISGATFKKNIGYSSGGAIAQQVYNNPEAYMMKGYEVSDLTLDPSTYVFENYACRGGGISVLANDSNSIEGNTKDKDGNTVTIASTFTVAFQLGGASVYSNYAESNGGGVCFVAEDNEEVEEYTKSILIDSGNIWDNEAVENGGGIYMQSSENTSLEIDGGFVSGNTACVGGGIYMNGANATCYIYGGTIGGKKQAGSTNPDEEMPNKALINADGKGGNGGAIALTGGATIKMLKKTASDGTVTTATISYNVAERKGGAIFLRSMDANNIPNTMEFEDGTIICNTSGIDYANTPGMEEKTAPDEANGGGIYVGEGGKFTLTNGILRENKALYGNGGAVYGNGATITIGKSDGTGSGQITKNSALGGGGISAENGATITVYSGTITENEASRGGGIHVTSGADLTVNGGYVTYNKATGECDQTTGYHLNTELVGTGGGIFIADGIAAAAATDTTEAVEKNLSVFTLSGQNVGIYGNTATFAADDVFANGNNTKLNVPLVSEMNMTDFNEKPEGWYEDYPNKDTSYAMGLKGGNPFRYKMAVATERVVILTYTDTANNNKETLLANVEDEYVCMTLGVAMAISDTIVLDFGLPVDIYVFGNDSTIRADNSYIAAISMTKPTLDGNFSTSLLISGDTITGTNFSAAIDSTSKDFVTFQYTTMSADSDVTFWYAAYYTTGSRYYYSTVTVVPATSIYYEDNAGMITYTEYTLTKNEQTNVTTKTPIDGAHWSNAGTVTTGKQDMDMPGKNENATSAGTQDATTVLSELDADNVYGYDSAYENMTTYSMGSAKMVTVNANKSASANFTFKGTGFDIISLTDKASGLIMVTVTGITDTTYKKSFLVDNYYQTGTLYQVPIMKVNCPTYGEYSVEIYVAYAEPFDHNQDQQCVFYLDAIRIYNPAQGNTTVEGVHGQDGELWPTYRELRKLVIDANTFNTLGSSTVSGVVFIDKTGGQVTIADYKNFGPNNELYLAKNQAVAFTLIADGTNIDNVHIGLRAPEGATKVKIYDSATTLEKADETDINSATDMYYDITSLNTKTVVIYNTGDKLLSITNIKTTHSSATTTGEEEVVMVNEDTGSNAIASIVAQSEDASIVPIAPSLAFDDEIRYNVYFSALNMSGVSVSDMGLAIFGGSEADGTVDTAVELVEGATFDGEKYMVHTNGIPAKNLGDAVYFKVYAKLADGTYVYSDLLAYHAVAYAKDILANSTNESMKALVVAMMNYGAAAQQYFGYNTDALMNNWLTDEQKADGYTEGMISGIPAVGANKAGQFVFNGGYTAMYPNVSFEGVFAINYYFTPENEPEGDMTFYYWNSEDFESTDVLTADNASGSVVMTATDGVYHAVVGDLAAKQIDEAVYVVGVYEADGVTYTTGVLGYSLGAYCLDRIENGGAAMQALAKATAVYGSCAEAYFAQG